MLCRNKFVNFQSNAPCTCIFWGSGSTPQAPSGGHASLGTTQQSRGVTLIAYLLAQHVIYWVGLLASMFPLCHKDGRNGSINPELIYIENTDLVGE